MTTTSAPSPDRGARLQFREDVDYFNTVWPAVRREHPDRYVAVYKGRVVANHKTLRGVLEAMDAKGVPKHRAVLRYVARKPRKMIL